MAGLIFPVSGPITSPYGWRYGVIGPGVQDFHTGLDFGVPVGTPIYATHNGFFSTENNYGGGLMLRVNGSSGWSTVYAHTSRAAVGAGTYVHTGQVIGFSGASGHDITGAHLHYEVRNQHGQLVDPRYTAPDSGPLSGFGLTGAFHYDAQTAQQQQSDQLGRANDAAAYRKAYDQQMMELGAGQQRSVMNDYSQITRSQTSSAVSAQSSPLTTGSKKAAPKRQSRFTGR